MITHSADETRAAGHAFARTLQPGNVVLLEGPLGSGKTTFVQGMAEGLGAKEGATSPSFVIVNEYSLSSEQRTVSSDQDKRTVHYSLPTAHLLRHLDLYRLLNPAVDRDRIGLPELLNDPTAITVVEWADRLPAEAVAKTVGRVLCVRIAHGTHERERILATEKRGGPNVLTKFQGVHYYVRRS